jgi:hypothetical protein
MHAYSPSHVLCLCIDTAFAKQQHMHDTLAGYGRAVVKEMRALAAERDASTTVTVSATTGATSGETSAASTAGGSDTGGTTETNGIIATTGVSGSNQEDSDKKGTNSARDSAKGKAKSKKQKNNVAHVVDKMLFNYRNIGTLCLVPVVHASDAL